MANAVPQPKKVGIEWVKDYPVSIAGQPLFPSLPHSGENGRGFRDWILGIGSGAGGGAGTADPATVALGFEFGDPSIGSPPTPTGLALARGKHLEENWVTPIPTGSTAAPALIADAPEAFLGEDKTNAELVDLLFFSGHGIHDRIFFSGPTQDDMEATSMEMQLGENGLKWFIADACNVLTTGEILLDADGKPVSPIGGDVIARWQFIFYGLRYLLGFHGTCSDAYNRGECFAKHLNLHDTIRHAWELACLESEGHFITWAYLCAGDHDPKVLADTWTGTNDLTSVPLKQMPTSLTYVRNIPPR